MTVLVFKIHFKVPGKAPVFKASKIKMSLAETVVRAEMLFQTAVKFRLPSKTFVHVLDIPNAVFVQ